MAQTTNNPTPQEIAERCAEIQKEWTPAERLKRLRVDLRPTVMTADGREVVANLDDDDST